MMSDESLGNHDRGGNILVVDDNPRNLALLEDILVQSGYAVRPAITGQLALLSARTRIPDLVLLDIRLPDISGYEVCRNLKKQPLTADVPVVFISALDDPLDKVKAFSEGGIDYITKPFQAEEVVVRIRTHLALKRMQLELKDRNQRLSEEIAERKSAQLQLQDAQRQLENRVRQRTEALAQALKALELEVEERRHAEEERTLLATALEQAAESIMITDAQTRIMYVNPFFEKISGYRKEEIVGKTPRFLQSGVHDRKFYLRLRQAIENGRGWQGRFTNRRKDGSLVQEDAVISPVFDAEGRITHYIAVKRDVTRTVQMEKQLQQAQKMEAIGTLAGGIAHDFNNILGAIIGCAEIAIAELPDRSRVRADLDRVLNAGQRARRLVQQILTFSRQTESERRPLKLQPIIKETVKFLRASLPASVEITTRLAKNDWAILADPVQIQQILLNLCTNGAHAMGNRCGLLEISLTASSLSKKDSERIGGIAPGDYFRLSVRDTGHGMNNVVLGRIFDPFFTTKGVGEGTGLGLSVVHGIITDLGGRIVVTSEPEQGSTFHVYLKREKVDVDTLEPPPSIPRSRNNERILVVDDEPYLADTMARSLQLLGYRPETCTSSLVAFEIFRESPNKFSMIVTDLTMPALNGDELIRRIREIRDDIPVIICTGYSDRIAAYASGLGSCTILHKPVLQWQLAQAAGNALDNKDHRQGERE